MRLDEIVRILNAELIVGHDMQELEITGGFGSDLLSDMLNRATDGVLLLTGLTNIQVIRSAVISSVTAIAFVRGKVPNEEIIRQAGKHALPLMVTPLTMFTACGRLYAGGLRGIEAKKQ